MSRVLRKPAFSLCENIDADQLRGNREADQRLCFRKTDEPEHQPSLIRAFTCAYSVAKDLNSDQPGCKVQITVFVTSRHFI